MTYIIPSWYNNNKYKESEESWYLIREKIEEDDSINQIRLFEREKVCDYEILLLSYAPNLRHFLHRHEIYKAPYFSLFDAVQCIDVKTQKLLSFHDLGWPEGSEFLYTNFAIAARKNGEKFAQIEFAEDGYLLRVDTYKGEELLSKRHYDDRGFLSSETFFENGEEKYQRFYDPSGNWKIDIHSDNTISVNPYCATYFVSKRFVSFAKLNYESFEELAVEVLRSYLRETKNSDNFIIAMDDFHSEILSKTINSNHTILSYYSGRKSSCDSKESLKLLANAEYILAPLDFALAKRYKIQKSKLISLPSFALKADPQDALKSVQRRILLSIENLTLDEISEVTRLIVKQMALNKKIHLTLFVSSGSYFRKEQIAITVRQILIDAGFGSDQKILDSGFSVEQHADESEILKMMKSQHLFIDLAPFENSYLQSICTSLCIPQIVAKPSCYVEDGENALVVSDFDEFTEAFAFYLENLANWNSAVAFAYQKCDEFEPAVLAEKWKGILAHYGSC